MEEANDSTNEGMIDISINYKGIDYTLTVDELTASELLNDPFKAQQYAEVVFQECKNTDANTKKKVWFSKGRPTKEDDEATALLLNLRQKYASKFNDKHTIYNTLWNLIAKEIEDHGYDLCPTKKEGSAGKCRQKFANLERQYIAHVSHQRRTGEEKKEPPPFFNELHSILGNKAKVSPEYLQDTALSDDSEASTSAGSSDKTDTSILNRFSKSKSTARPRSISELLLKEFQQQHVHDREDRNKQYTEVKMLLETQNEQRKRMLDLFADLVQCKRQKM